MLKTTTVTMIETMDPPEMRRSTGGMPASSSNNISTSSKESNVPSTTEMNATGSWREDGTHVQTNLSRV